MKHIFVAKIVGFYLSKIHPFSRAQIIYDINDFVRTGQLSYSISFNLIKYLRYETELAKLLSIKKQFIDIRNALDEESGIYEGFRKFVLNLVELLQNWWFWFTING